MNVNQTVTNDIREAVASCFTFGVSVEDFLATAAALWEAEAYERGERDMRTWKTVLSKKP